jgi:NDP-sugar pyrophosphorylase family protein
MDAVILADRLGDDLAPLDEFDCPALLPIAGKAVVEHCLEDLWEAGIREATIAFPETHPHLPRRIGDGARFGMRVRYLATRGEAWPSEVVRRAKPASDRVLVARGDVLRGRAARLVREASDRSSSGSIIAMHGRRHAGMAVYLTDDLTASSLDWSLLPDTQLPMGLPGIGVDHAGVNLLDSPAAWHRAGMLALAGRFRGLLPAGRGGHDAGLITGPRCVLARSVSVDGIARVGRNASVRDGVMLTGYVDIGDDCVIDSGAEISDSIVLPGTYVGRGTRLTNAIVSGRWLLRPDLGSVERLDDPLLLDQLPGWASNRRVQAYA